MTRWSLILKKALDVFASSVLLILFSPLLALLALLIKFQDGGPVLYRRRVLGPGGEFDALKLRSMQIDADEVLSGNPLLRKEFEENFKLTDDPRITRVGAFLRRYSLDELPQLFNALRGEMSLVGPRMISPAEREKHGEAGWVFQRMKPGLTGYWQVHGRQKVSYAQRVEMDLFYAKNWPLLLDIKILLKTPIQVLRGEGAN